MSSCKLRSRVVGVALAMASLGITGIASAQTPGPYVPPPPAASPYGPPPAAAPYAAPAPAPYAPPPAYGPAPAPYNGGGMYGGPERRGVQRDGLMFGIGIGGGAMNCSECSDDDALGGVAVDLHLGAMLTPKLGLMFDGSAIAHPFDGGGTLVHAVDTIAAQFFVTDRLWLKGGIGLGQLSLQSDDGRVALQSDTGPAGMFAVGFEVMQAERSALDVQFRVASTTFEDADVTITNASFNVAYNWY